MCLFYKASGAAASHEARNSGRPYSPKQLAKAFEATLYEIFTDPQGHFKQRPGIYPEEAEARQSATAFIAEVFGEASLTAFLPIPEPESLCQQFLQSAIEDRQRDWDSIQKDPAGDIFVQRELNQEGAEAQHPAIAPDAVTELGLDELFAAEEQAQLVPDDLDIDPDLRAITLQNLVSPPTPDEEE